MEAELDRRAIESLPEGERKQSLQDLLAEETEARIRRRLEKARKQEEDE